jgi:Tn3 transposase DDE domain
MIFIGFPPLKTGLSTRALVLFRAVVGSFYLSKGWVHLAYLERAIAAMKRQNRAVDPTLLRYLSPLGWEHSNLTGDYLWRTNKKIGPGKFRPLRPFPGA